MINIYQLIIFMCFCLNAALAGNFLIRFFFEKKPKSNLLKYVYILLFSSMVWSIGMGLMSLQTNDHFAYFFRTFGILGTFIFMAAIQFSLSYLSEIPQRLKSLVNGLSLLGIPIFFAYSIPGQTIFVHNTIGTTFYFKQGLINNIYSLYFFVVSLNIFLVTLHTAKKSSLKRTAVAAKRFIVVELCVFVGAIFDMILPSFEIAAFPGSAITHFWGVVIFWLALHEMFKSELTIANMSEYVYHSLNSPILIFNPKNKLEIINAASISFFDINEENFEAGKYSIDFLFDTDETIFAFEGKGYVHKAVCKSNNAKCEILINKINDSYNDVIGFICLVNDLTDHEMVITGLEQAKLAADAANMSKSLFLANMSHEIRTPMNAILGFSEIALMEDVDEKAKGYFSEIKQAGNILLSVINEILNISKIELGKNEVESINYKASRLIKDVELITRTNANKKNLSFTVNIDKAFPEELYGDSNKIREILLNVLGNAVKYTNAGSVELKGSAIIKENQEAVLHFEISDTGIGIKPEDIDTIFDKFSRVDAQLNSSTEGTGLGLSITKGLVELLEGTIEVESTYGVGTTFIINIPQKVTGSDSISLSDSDTEQDVINANTLQLTNCHFLVVDDTKTNLKIATKYLEKYEAQIDTCLSGPDSIELCRKNTYNIIFMDHMMPGMDGVEAMKQIRLIPGYEKGSSNKIVALTANAVDSAKELLMSEGFDDFISKPMKKDILDQAIRRILSI